MASSQRIRLANSLSSRLAGSTDTGNAFRRHIQIRTLTLVRPQRPQQPVTWLLQQQQQQQAISLRRPTSPSPSRIVKFHSSRQYAAQPASADSLMENLNDLYGTARDEFEIAMEETQANTVYAADDREAAVEAFAALKEAYEQTIREADPETGSEIQSRVGQRIRELEAAIENMNKIATEGD